MKGFSTKYALTQGIAEVEVEVGFAGTPNYVYSKGPYRDQFVVGQTFFTERDEALKNAREQACRKAVSLEKALAKVKALAVTPRWAPGKVIVADE